MTDRWATLRRFTDARIALGSAGHALPTAQVLDLALAHALARDAIYEPFDAHGLHQQLEALGCDPIQAASAATDRQTYLRRPDLGRRLDPGVAIAAHPCDVAFVLADGLSPLAVNRHAIPLLEHTLPLLRGRNLSTGPVVIATQARVALGDEIGARLQARLIAMLIGERPGMSAPDSLGVYLTFDPKPGSTDAARNCVSNIRAEGLSYQAAAHRLIYLISEALRRQLTGVALKDESRYNSQLGQV